MHQAKSYNVYAENPNFTAALLICMLVWIYWLYIIPLETSPVIEPLETSPVIEPLETSPVIEPLETSPVIDRRTQNYKKNIERDYHYFKGLLIEMETYPGDDFKYILKFKDRALERLDKLLQESQRTDDDYQMIEIWIRMRKMQEYCQYNEHDMELCYFYKPCQYFL